MKGFTVFSCVVTLFLLATIPFIIGDLGIVGTIIFLLIAGSSPVISAIVGVIAWRKGELDDEKTIERILNPL